MRQRYRELLLNYIRVMKEIGQFVDVNRRQVVLLSDHGQFEKPGRMTKRVQWGMSTDAYVLTLPAAQAILRLNCPMRTPCDHWARWVKQDGIELYRTYPILASQAWDVHPSHIKQPKLKNPLWARVLRHLGYFIDRLLLQFEKYKVPRFAYSAGYSSSYSINANANQKVHLVKILNEESELSDAPRRIIHCASPSSERGFIKVILQRIFLWRRFVLFCWDPPGIFWRDRKDWIGRFRCWVLNQLQSAAILCSRVTIFNLHRGFAEANLWRCAVKRCRFFPNGTCIAANQRAAEGVAHVPHRIAISNTFMVRKGCFWLADRLIELKRRVADLSVVWVGADHGDLAAVRERLLSDGFSVSELVHLGPAKHEEALRLWASAGIGFNAYPDQPSVRWNYVLKLPEFMSLGLPVVSVDLPGAREYVTSDVGALFVSGDEQGAVDAIIELLSERALFSEYRGRALSVVHAYDWSEINRQIASAVMECFGG